ncbi:MAG: hypothetical protein WBZ48_07540 [Bacteroidota bacterium]
MPTKNPLQPFVIAALASIIYAVYEILFKHRYEPFTIIAGVLACVFIYLYQEKSKHAGQLMFFSTVPVYPLYFAGMALGLIKTPARTGVYYVMGSMYVVGVIIFWKAKIRYETYLKEIPTKKIDKVR